MINKYVLDSTINFFSKIDLTLLNPLDAEAENVSIPIDMYPIIRIGEDKQFIFIPTGTKSSPKGIISTKAKFCLVLDHVEGRYVIVETKALKNLIKSNIGMFERGLGYDFETSGFKLGFDDFYSLLISECEVIYHDKIND